MGLDTVLRKGVATLDKVTKSLQVQIQHYAWLGQDTFGEGKFSPPFACMAIMEPMHKMVNFADGRNVFIVAKLIILQIVPSNGADLSPSDARMEPIDRRDKIILADGFSGPIVDIKSVTDPKTDLPYHHEILIGRPSGD